MPNSKITLADIAKLAGVSTSTVSRALTDSPQISDPVKRSIKALARQHNYHPHLGARNLRLRKTNVIGLVLPIEANDAATLSNPFVLEFVGAVGLELRQYECNLLLLQERMINPQLWNSGLVDGYLMLGHGNDPGLLNEVSGLIPLVVWGNRLAEQQYVTVGVDNTDLARQAVEHLIQLGRRRIGIIVGTFGANNTESYLRYRGYCQALSAAGLNYDPALVVFTEFDANSAYCAARQILDQAPQIDALFAAHSDVVALAAIQALGQAGRRVPQDVAVIGFDNISLGMHFGLPLTTVSQEVQSTGARVLVKTLMQLIAGEPAESTTIAGKLMVRQSCGAGTS